MIRHSRPMLALALTIVPATFAHAALKIMHHATQNVTCSAGVCGATAADAVLNIHDLTALLAGGSVTVQSTSLASDIIVSKEFSWASANTLTLDAFRAITFKESIVVAGPGGLTIKTNDGGSGGDFVFKHAHVEFWDLASALEINGQAFTLVNALDQLAAAVAANPSGNYALAKNIRAGDHGAYATAPVPTPLSGTFEGLGNAVKRLKIVHNNPSQDVGLFMELSAGGIIRDLAMVTADFETHAHSGNAAGVLVARNFGTLAHIKTSGVLFGQLAGYAGGIAGLSGQGAQIVDGDSSVRVTFPGSAATHVGGVVGFNDGTIAASKASGPVLGGKGSNAGGLAGESSVHGSVTDSFASGGASSYAGNAAGGLVGVNDNMIVHCYATNGPIVDAARNGGLVGINNGTILLSYATGNGKVSDDHDVSGGGLVGNNAGTISQSYATGHFDGIDKAALGGLAGINTGAIENSYAFGGVSGSQIARTMAGGLVGLNLGTLSASYSIGFVAGPENRFGGAIGLDQNVGGAGAIYWATDSSTVTDPAQGAGRPRNDPGITATNNAQLRAALPAGFDAAVWGQSASINGGLPYLLALPPSP